MPDLRPAVLLDVDGTVLDTNYLHVLAWWQAFEDTGRGPIAMSSIHRVIGIPSDGLVRHHLGEHDDKTVDAHSKRYEPLRENVKPSGGPCRGPLSELAGAGERASTAARAGTSDSPPPRVPTATAAGSASRSDPEPSTSGCTGCWPGPDRQRRPAARVCSKIRFVSVEATVGSRLRCSATKSRRSRVLPTATCSR